MIEKERRQGQTKHERDKGKMLQDISRDAIEKG